MDKRERAGQLLAELGETLKIEQITPDESKVGTVLVFDDHITLSIDFKEDTGCLVLSSNLGELPEDNAEPLLRELLVADLYWHRTAGATLGLDEDTGTVVLTQAQNVTE